MARTLARRDRPLPRSRTYSLRVLEPGRVVPMGHGWRPVPQSRRAARSERRVVTAIAAAAAAVLLFGASESGAATSADAPAGRGIFFSITDTGEERVRLRVSHRPAP